MIRRLSRAEVVKTWKTSRRKIIFVNELHKRILLVSGRGVELAPVDENTGFVLLCKTINISETETSKSELGKMKMVIFEYRPENAHHRPMG